jgi:hypothetical protein
MHWQCHLLTFLCVSDLSYAGSPTGGPYPKNCVDDGMQFHLSKLRGKGIYHWPYDSGQNSAYRIVGQPEDIQQWNLTLEVRVPNFLYATPVIDRRDSETNVQVARWAGQLPVGGNMLVYATLTLPLQFMVNRTSCRYEFNYGDSNTDGNRWLGFNNQDAGYEPSPNPKSAKPVGQYCDLTDMPNDPRGHAQRI